MADYNSDTGYRQGFSAGSDTSVQADDPGSQSAGGIAGLFGAEAKRAQGPNTAAYNRQMYQSDQDAGVYGDLGRNYTQKGPTIANQFQDQSRAAIDHNIGRQQVLADDLMHNNGEASRAQFQSQLDQGIDAQMAVANSTRGGAIAAAGARRQAAMNGAQMQMQGAAQAAALGAQEREQAQGLAANLYGQVGNQLQGQYGLEQGSAISQGQLDSANQAQQNQMRLGYAGIGQQAQGQSLNALNNYTSQNLAAQGLSAGFQQQAQAATNQMIGTAAGVAGTMMGGPAGGAAASAAANAATGGSGGGGSGPPKYAHGGAFNGQHPIMVGENGPEIIYPQSPGYVMTAQQTAALRGAPPTPFQQQSLAQLYGAGASHQAAASPTSISALYTPRQASLNDAIAGNAQLKARMAALGGQ